MKIFCVLIAMLLVASCGSDDAASDTTTPSDSESGALAATEVAFNEGVHRYRYAEKTEGGDCTSSAEVGDELTQTTTFVGNQVTIIFERDDLPEGTEPGKREYSEQVDQNTWREDYTSSSGSLMEHTIEFTEAGVIMASFEDGELCLSSVRDRIDV